MKTLTVSALLCAIMALTTAAALSGVKDEGGSVTGNDGGEHHVAERSLCCPKDWHEYDGTCFIYVPQKRTWAEAESYCLGFGANLASVHSLQQYNWLRRMIATVSHGNPETWIGGSDCQQVGKWFWTDGTPFKYSFWAPGQPDNHNGGQGCIQMNWGAYNRWDNLQCNLPRSSVCAKKI